MPEKSTWFINVDVGLSKTGLYMITTVAEKKVQRSLRMIIWKQLFSDGSDSFDYKIPECIASQSAPFQDGGKQRGRLFSFSGKKMHRFAVWVASFLKIAKLNTKRKIAGQQYARSLKRPTKTSRKISKILEWRTVHVGYGAKEILFNPDTRGHSLLLCSDHYDHYDQVTS